MLTRQNLFLTTLILYLVIGMHIVLPTPGGAGLYLAPNIIGWCFISALISIGLFFAYKNSQFVVHQSFKFLLLGFLLLLLPFVYANELSYLAIPRVLAVLGIILLFIALFQTNFRQGTQQKVIVILLLGIAIEATIGLVQFYLLQQFDINILGYTPLFGKPYGTFTQNNVMASFLATGIAISFYIHVRDWWQNSKLLKLLCGYMIASAAILLVLLQSKTGFLGALFVLLLFIPQLKQHKARLKFAYFALMLGVGVGVISQIQLQIPVKESIASDKGVRSTIYAVSFDMLKEKPLAGYGYGHFERAYREFHLQAMQENTELPPPLNNLGHPHNEFLYWGIEGGISALLGLIVFALVIIKVVLQHSGVKNRLLYVALILPLLLHSQIEYPFSHSIVHLVYLVVLVWFISESSNDVESIKKYPVSTKLLPFGAIMISLLVMPFMLTTLQTSYLMEKFKQSNNQAVEFINAIINPAGWQQYYEMVIYTQGLQNGYKNQDTKALKRYIDWGKQYVAHTPREGIYRNMISAMSTLDKVGESINAETKEIILNEYQRLYPQFTEKVDIKKAP